jgi:hypothetical protein
MTPILERIMTTLDQIKAALHIKAGPGYVWVVRRCECLPGKECTNPDCPYK